MRISTVLPRGVLNEVNLINIGLKFSLIALFFLNFSSGFAQQKVINQQEWQQKLSEVNAKIQQIDQSIATINSRIVGVLPENIEPSVQVRLNDLQIQKNQYEREKISIEAILNTSQNSITPIRQQSLAYADRSRVIENI